MKLRKAARNAPLDLDDPLESSDSDYETSDYEYLSDVIEGDEGDEDGELEGSGRGGHDDGDAWDDGDEPPADDTADDGDGTPDGEELVRFAEGVVSSTESGRYAWDNGGGEQREAAEEEQQQQLDGEEEGDDDDEGDGDVASSSRVAFNPFDLLSDASSSDADWVVERRRAALCTADALPVLLPDTLDDTESDAGGGAGAGKATERRRRRQRKNRRRRRRGTDPAPATDEGVAPAAAVVSDAAGITAGKVGGSDEEEVVVADCWLCFGEGRVAQHGARGASGWEHGCGGVCDDGASCKAAGGGGDSSNGAGGCGGDNCKTADGGCGGGNCKADVCGGDGGDAEDELVAPCRTCAGGLRYIHRSCFEGWLKSSWALACPNCRQLYDSSVLKAFSAGVSVPSMLLAACPPGHDLRQALPPHSCVYFCVAGVVELSMTCGGFTPVELLRHMRGFLDEMARRGGDGGLGVQVEGEPLQLPSFEVTGLALDLGPQDGGSSSSSGPGARNTWRMPPLVDDGLESYGRNWWRADAGDEHDDDDNDHATVESYIAESQGSLPWVLELEARNARRGFRWAHTEAPPPPAPPVPLRGVSEQRASALRSVAERAAVRAEQQRQRADLLLQQRNQQRHAGGSRGQQAMSGAPRSGGGGRRR